MNETEPTWKQKLALQVADDTYSLPLVIGAISLFVLFSILCAGYYLLTGIEPIEKPLLVLFLSTVISALVIFLLLRYWFMYLVRGYIQKNNHYSDWASPMLLEIDSNDKVINYTWDRFMLKSLDRPCTYASANMYFFWPNKSMPWRDRHIKTMDHEFEIMVTESFGLRFKLSLELEMTAEFNPQEIYELLAKPGIDMRQYFRELIDKSVQKEIISPWPAANEYWVENLTEIELAQTYLEAIKIEHSFSNLKVKKFLEKPMRFVQY